MRQFRMSLALVMASGLCAGVAGAQVNLGNTTTRAVVIKTEDTTCENTGTPDAGFYPANGDADCTSAGWAGNSPAPLCTGLGTGTYGGPRGTCGAQPAAYYPNCTARGPMLSPNFQVAPQPACNQFANGGTPDFSDTTTDFYGTLSFVGGTTWNLTVSAAVWGEAVKTTLANTPGTSLVSNSTLALTFNSATGAVAPQVPPNYYTANATYAGPPALALTLKGVSQTPDQVFFGTGYQLGNTAPLTHSCGATFTIDNAATGSTVASAFPPFPSTETGVAFGPGYPWALPAACATLIPQPGWDTASSTLTAFAASLVELAPGFGAVDPAWAPYDWKLVDATDTDGDLVPNLFDTDDDNDGILDKGNASCTAAGLAGVQAAACCSGLGTGTCGTGDNCRVVANASQCNADVDAYGNQCDPDTNNTNTLTVGDFNAFRNAYNAALPLGDMNCSSSFTVGDFNLFRNLYNNVVPGRLISCAGQPADPDCN